PGGGRRCVPDGGRGALALLAERIAVPGHRRAAARAPLLGGLFRRRLPRGIVLRRGPARAAARPRTRGSLGHPGDQRGEGSPAPEAQAASTLEYPELNGPMAVPNPPAPCIVLVQDDLRLAELVRSYLASSGVEVAGEHRGEQVVGRCCALGADLVMLDLGLPGKDGFAVCRELRAAFSIPILILTARDNDIDHVLGLELGADDYVIKPVEPRVLVARI